MNTRLAYYFIGISWFILSLFSSAFNDIITKYTGMRINSFEVAFFRFAFSTLTLIPFIIYYGKQTLKTDHIYIHLSRGALLFFGMTAWTHGMNFVPVSTATVISFAIPLFVLILATFFLDEVIIWQRWLVTVIGIAGIIVTLKPHAVDFDPNVLFFVGAAVAFAMLDIINKKFVVKESMISMLFYSAIVTSILALPPTIIYWQTPSLSEISLLFMLGISANLILFLILKAFALVDATALAPYRYLELVISATFGYLVFHELPSKSTLYGALIIIPSTLFIVYSERKVIEKI